MSRICAVCKQPPREGQEMRPIRIRDHQFEVAKEAFPELDGCALYSACLDCAEKFREQVAEELEVEVSAVTNYMMC